MRITPGVKPILDEEIRIAMSELPLVDIVRDKHLWIDNGDTGKLFTDYHYEWIRSSKLNKIHGLEKFPLRHLTNGCTESLQEYHWMFRNHRLRLFEGEYMFTGHLSLKDKFTYMHQDDLREGDALIVSVPFNQTGGLISNYETVMQRCTELNIPVLVDCCFFGTCTGLEFSVDYDCVKSVCFSTSKTFATGTFRVGTLFTKEPTDHIGALNNFFYTPLLASRIHLEMLHQFSPDWIPNKYRKLQERICNQFGVKATPTMMIANADHAYPDIDLEKFAGGVYKKGWPYVQIDNDPVYRWGLSYALADEYGENK